MIVDGQPVDTTARAALDRSEDPVDGPDSGEALEPASLQEFGFVGQADHGPLTDEPTGEVYFPPTDPVLVGAVIACGFSHTSMDPMELQTSELDGRVGDEALADAVRLELRTDAATSTLDIDVTVEDRVAYLKGRVADIEDVENAEEVASRLPQVSEVVDELDIGSG